MLETDKSKKVVACIFVAIAAVVAYRIESRYHEMADPLFKQTERMENFFESIAVRDESKTVEMSGDQGRFQAHPRRLKYSINGTARRSRKHELPDVGLERP
jgi:hypothetical protein